jgi:enoyl-CoA hydratase/carnithine racemase
MNPTEFNDIQYEKDADGIVTLTLAQPKRKNAMSPVTFLELYYAVEALEHDDKAYAMIITGAKDPDITDPRKEAFSSGGYFHPKAMEGVSDVIKSELDLTDIAQKRCTLKFWRCEKPIIAAVNGFAIGAGVTMPLSGCDLIYASEHAWFQFPFVRLGIIPELAFTYLMPRMVGFQKASELALFGEKISAKEAQELGFVNRVVPHEDLISYAKQRALLLAPPHGPNKAVKAAKRALHQPYIDAIESALDIENKGLQQTTVSSDFVEANMARMQKRNPVFSGE